MTHSSVHVLASLGALSLARRMNDLAALAQQHHRAANRAMNKLGPEVVKQAFLEREKVEK